MPGFDHVRLTAPPTLAAGAYRILALAYGPYMRERASPNAFVRDLLAGDGIDGERDANDGYIMIPLLVPLGIAVVAVAGNAWLSG